MTDSEVGGLTELLQELKERTPFSYSALAKRLGMSPSTLHRYCHGASVPTDYAPIERFARLCKATPAELSELHRRWARAYAHRASAVPKTPFRQDPEGEPVPRPLSSPGPPGHHAPQPDRTSGISLRRRRLLSPIVISAAVLLIGGITAGLLSNRSTDGARDGTADAAPDEKSPASNHAPPPDSLTHIDAALPTPDSLDRDGLDRAPDKYWLFSSDHYIRVRLSTEQHSTNPVHDRLTPVSSIGRWASTLNKFPEFRSGIDAALRVPGHQNEYWVFSRDKYIRIRIADTPPYYEDTLLDSPKPISEDWKTIFRGLRLHDIDALMPVPNDPEQVWVFAGKEYVRVKISETASRKPRGTVQTGPMNIGEGWKNTFGDTPEFKNGIDEVVPVPGDPNKYWVFSGAQYMKINVTDTEYMDTVDKAPRKLSL